MIQTSPVHPAPGELEFVRAFVNSRDVEAGTDELRDPASWRAWARIHGIAGSASSADLDVARRVRESIRVALLANHDRGALPVGTVSALNEAATRAHVAVSFGAEGPQLQGSGSGVDAAFARIVAAAAHAMSDGSWSRLKACASDECQWGFYDTSRSRSGQWCSMRLCGNRAKQARWRGAPERSRQ